MRLESRLRKRRPEVDRHAFPQIRSRREQKFKPRFNPGSKELSGRAHTSRRIKRSRRHAWLKRFGTIIRPRTLNEGRIIGGNSGENYFQSNFVPEILPRVARVYKIINEDETNRVRKYQRRRRGRSPSCGQKHVKGGRT